MQINISSPKIKLQALLRYLYLKVLRPKKVAINNISFIGRNFKIFVSKKGKISVNGKIHIADYVELQSKGILSFGNACAINSFSRVIAFEKIEFGDRVLMAQHVSILDHDHSFKDKNGKLEITGFNSKPIKIGNNVWLADKVTVTKGVTIGDNVIIAANSVVTKDIPSNCLAGGIPAKVIKSIP